MSRHRNVRSMNYSEEYDGFDDVYGHSVEDDYCISPSDEAQFMYDRTRQPQMSAFFNEEDDIAEEDETGEGTPAQGKVRCNSESYRRPALSDIDEAKLLSCLEEIRNVIGDSVPENFLIEAVLKNDFDISTSLDAVLSTLNSTAEKESNDAPKPQRVRKDRERDDEFISPQCSLYDFFSERDVSRLRRGIEELGIQDSNKTQFNIPSSSTSSEATSLHDSNVNVKTNLKSHAVASPLVVPFSSTSVPSKSLSSRDIPEHSSFPGNIKLIVQSSGDCFNGPLKQVQYSIPSEIIIDNNGASLSSFVQDNVAKVQVENMFQQPDNSSLQFNIPRLQIKIRKDSDKENVENLSSDEHETDVHLSSAALAMKQSTLRRATDSKEAIHSILSPQNLSTCNERYSNVSSPFGLNLNLSKNQNVNFEMHTFDQQQNSDEEIEFSPLMALASKHSQPTNMPSECSNYNQNLDEEIKFPLPSQTFRQTKMKSNTLNEQTNISCNENSDEEIEFSPLIALAHRHSRPSDNQLRTTDEEYSKEDDINFSPLAALAGRHKNLQENANSPPSLLARTLVLPERMNVAGIHQTSGPEKGGDAMLEPCQVMSSMNTTCSTGISNNESLEESHGTSPINLEESHVTSLINLVAQCAVDEKCTEHNSFPSIVQPLSSLSDLATHHLTHSSSCQVMEEQLGSAAKLSSSPMDISVSRRFLIPCLGSSVNTDGDLKQCIDSHSNLSEEVDDDWVIDLSSAIRSPESIIINDLSKVKLVPQVIQYEITEAMEFGAETIPDLQCVLDASEILSKRYSCSKRKSSTFGKSICRKWRSLPLPYIPCYRRTAGNLIPFCFDSLSPDDKILKELKRVK